jgi:hypothetical protein
VGFFPGYSLHTAVGVFPGSVNRGFRQVIDQEQVGLCTFVSAKINRRSFVDDDSVTISGPGSATLLINPFVRS